ncbi:MAG: oxidoreductase [Proteobacteria bacterium]|nr:oxidoreductase [Pseudomonadota bacterium]
MKKYYMTIDVEQCEDCNDCFLACKDEFYDNDFPPYSVAQPRHGQRWMNIMRKERGAGSLMDVAYLPTPCQHCEDPACRKKAGNGAIQQRKDGIVLIDPAKAKGKKEIATSCPYDAIFWNEEREVAQKCTFCAHLLDTGWKEPRCVQACPARAIRVLKADEAEMRRIAETEGMETLHPQHNTQPRVYYKNLHRYFKCFIAGSVAYKHDDIADCAESASVVLNRGSEAIAEATTDNYGDFKFDKLEEKSGIYTLEISFDGFDKKIVEVDLEKSVNLGDVYL